MGKTLRWGTPRGLLLQMSCSSPEAARRDGVPLRPFQTLFCFFLSFLPTGVKQQTPPWIFVGYLQMGCSVCVVINLGFFLLVFVLAKFFYLVAFSLGRMLKFLCLIAYQAGCWKPLFGFAEGGGIACVYGFCLPTNYGLFSEHTPIHGFCIFICVCR